MTPGAGPGSAPLLGNLLLDDLVATVLSACADSGRFAAALDASPAAQLPGLAAGDFAAGPEAALSAVVEQGSARSGDLESAVGVLACLLALVHRGRFVAGLPARVLEGAFLELAVLPAPWGARFAVGAAAARAQAEPPQGSAGEAAAALHRVGRFRILSLLGQGGTGTVYRARQDGTDRDVALKLLRADALTPGSFARFQREAVLLGRLDHPAIARVFDTGLAQVHGGTVPFLALEFVEGTGLLAHAANAKLADSQRIELVRQVAEAVQHAHGHGIVHRDLSPANVLVARDGRPKVIDFGVARLLDHGGAGSAARTHTGDVIGTPAYMSPEQAAGNPERVGRATDVWSLGVLLFKLLTGRLPLPVAGKPLSEVLRVLAADEPARLRSLRQDLGADLDAVLGKALEREPADRYPSAGAFADDLALVLAGASVTVRAPTRFERARRFVRRNRGAVAAVAAVVVALAAGLVVATVGWKRAADNLDALAAVFELPLAVVDANERSLRPTDKNVEILRKIEQALEPLQDLPERNQFTRLAAFYCEQFGDACMRQQRPAEAETHFRRCAGFCNEQAALEPGAVPPRARLATALAKLGNSRRDQGFPAEAEELFRQALAIDQQLVAAHPDDDELWDDLAWCYQRLAAVVAQQDETATECELAAQALHAMRKAWAAKPRDEDRIFGMGTICMELGYALQRHGAQDAEIGPWYDKAREFATTLARDHADNPDYAAFLASLPPLVGSWLFHQQQPEAALPRFTEGLSVARRWLDAGLQTPGMQRTVVDGHTSIARAHLAAGDLVAAATAVQRARQELLVLDGARVEAPQGTESLVRQLDGDIALRRGARADAERLWREALQYVPPGARHIRAAVLVRLVRNGMADARERTELDDHAASIEPSTNPLVVRIRIDMLELHGETATAEQLRVNLQQAAQPVVERVRTILAQ